MSVGLKNLLHYIKVTRNGSDPSFEDRFSYCQSHPQPITEARMRTDKRSAVGVGNRQRTRPLITAAMGWTAVVGVAASLSGTAAAAAAVHHSSDLDTLDNASHRRLRGLKSIAPSLKGAIIGEATESPSPPLRGLLHGDEDTYEYSPNDPPDWFDIPDIDFETSDVFPSNDIENYIPRPPPMQGRVVGGNAVTDSEKYDFSASLHKDGKHWCGGVLVSPQAVLTAGHCCLSGGRPGADEAIFQTLHKDGDPNTSIRRAIDPSKCITHDGYVEKGYLFDTCVCPLEGDPIDPADVAPIEINTNPKFPLDHSLDPGISKEQVGMQVFTVMGYGATSGDGQGTDYKHEVDVAYIDQDRCLRAFRNKFIKPDMMCAILPGQDACQGDSGGPLVYRRPDGSHLLVGTTSWGFACADPHYPGVYSRSASYFPWLRQTICKVSTSSKPQFFPPDYLQCPGRTQPQTPNPGAGNPFFQEPKNVNEGDNEGDETTVSSDFDKETDGGGRRTIF